MEENTVLGGLAKSQKDEKSKVEQRQVLGCAASRRREAAL